jgi:hypothetical protein
VYKFLFVNSVIASAFRHLWHTLKGSWEEFEQHSQSLEQQSQHLLSYQTNAQHGTQTSVPVQTPVSCRIAGSSKTADPMQFGGPQVPDSAVSGITVNSAAAAPASATASAATTAVTSSVAVSNVDSLRPAADANAGRDTVLMRRVMPTKTLVQQTQLPDVANAPASGNNGPSVLSIPLPGKWAQAKDFMRRTMAVFTPANNAQCDSVTPRGLQNYSGQNLCFINAALQALSKTSSLADDLIATRSPSRPAIVYHMANLFEGLTTTTAARGHGALTTNDFRMAASLRSRGLIVSPFSNQKQPQQDVAEFLTWLLSELHLCLNGAAEYSAVTSVQPNYG